jgi:hypothetical protein
MTLKSKKKADISITILVLGVVALCFLTIMSFASKNNKADLAGVGLIETMKSFAEENAFYSETGFKSEDYKNGKLLRGNVEISPQGNDLIGTYKKGGKTLARVEYKK